MELVTRSKRPGMRCSLDVFYDHTKGFSKYINDKTMYKIMLLRSGSFVYEDEGKYRLVHAPASLALSEKAEFNVLSESDVEVRTVFFKPSIIREEFTYEAIDSGIYDKFLSAVQGTEEMSFDQKLGYATGADIKFEDSFSNNMIYQDALYVLQFKWRNKDNIHNLLTRQEYDTLRRLFLSIEYEINEQPDNFWILRTRHFITSILFMEYDFYRNNRQDDIYDNPLVARVSRYFWDKLSDEITLSDVLKEFSVNKNTLNEAFYNELDMSCMTYLEQMRVNIAKYFLQFSDYSVSYISEMCGYNDTNYFTKVFKKHTGMTASEFQKQVRGRDMSESVKKLMEPDN
jgi:Response regulator containing CheY-like receiver domain and AraC-type DNA-binding domain